MEYGVTGVNTRSSTVLVNGGLETLNENNRMCKDPIDNNSSKKVDNMNNISSSDSQDLISERVLEMYNMLIGISSEIGRIKCEIQKRNSEIEDIDKTKLEENDSIEFNFSNLINQQEMLGNGVKYETEVCRIDPKGKNETKNGGTVTWKENLHLNVPEAADLEKKTTTLGYIKEEDQSPSPSGPINPPSPFLIVANKFMGGPVILNVGGKRHEVRWNTLDKFPTSRLGRLRHCVTHRGLLKICDAYSLEEREYFFDRSPRNFDAILGLYRNGKLHLAAGVCVQDFCEELEYWGLDDLHMEPCCQHTYYRARWLLPETTQDEEVEDNFGNGFCAPTQKQLWNLFENPHHSKAAKVVAIVSCLFVVVSTLCLIFSTLPAFHVKDESGKISQEEYFFEVAEAVFVGWFSFEYVIRFVAAPQKSQFVKGAMNIIDLLGILPYFMSLLLSLVTVTGDSGDDQGFGQSEMRRIAQIFRIMRILRIFKLARHITGLQTLGMTLKNSYKELGLLMLVVIMGMLIFSGLAYVGEKDEEGTMFDSMPTALYWAIITMTSVGYGDIHPVSWFGKLVGSVCAICGVLCISLPIPIIVNNFNKFYEKSKIEEEITLKKTQSSWEEGSPGQDDTQEC